MVSISTKTFPNGQNIKVEWLYHWPLTAFKAICQDLVIKLVAAPSSSSNGIDFNQNPSQGAKYHGPVVIPLVIDGFQKAILPGSGNQIGCGAQFIPNGIDFNQNPSQWAKFQGRLAIPLAFHGFQSILPGSGHQIGYRAQFTPKGYRFQPKPSLTDQSA